MKKLIILLFLTLTLKVSAQNYPITKFSLQDTTVEHRHSSIIELEGSNLLFFWIESGKLKVANSNDGINWGSSKIIIDSLSEDRLYQDLATYNTNSGKIIIAYRINESITEYNLISSVDNGATWSEPTFLISSPIGNPSWNGKFSQTNDDKVWFTFNRTSTLNYIISENDGVTWSEKKSFSPKTDYGTVISTDDSLMMIYEGRTNLLFKRSYDGGDTWSEEFLVLDDEQNYFEPSAVQLEDGSILIVYKLLNSSGGSNYNYIKSFDNGNTWSEAEQFTKFLGLDYSLNLNSNSKLLIASFISNRAYNYSEGNNKGAIWYGIIGSSDENYTPPFIEEYSHLPSPPIQYDTISFIAKVYDEESISTVYLNTILNNVEQPLVEMFDDGLHNDGIANDSIFGISLSGFDVTDILAYSFSANDNFNNLSERSGETIFFALPHTSDKYYMNINRFKLPIDNKGILASVDVDSIAPGGNFDGNTILFSGGFGLSGYANGELWANGVVSSSRIEDYQEGIVGSIKDDPINVVYSLKSRDEPFGASWQVWKHAVKQGAKYYDGDNNGEYTPIDLNGNGTWDENEDRPDLIGDVTAWTVFNDAIPSEMRRFDVSPKDIEIKQTLFAYLSETYEELDGVIFVRYSIENKSGSIYDSAYFSVMTDPDVGDHVNDYTGSDTLLNASYTYDKESDSQFGNSPTLMTMIIQGAPVYIDGVTYIDNNNNGIFNGGVDTPLDTAKYYNGKYFDEMNFIGAKNLETTSFINYMGSHVTHGDPSTRIELRNYQEGLKKDGEELNPCEWTFGEVFNQECNSINPHFMYSGNPVTNIGWLNIEPIDQKMILSSGPFALNPNEPVEFIVAYVAGRGSTSLESVDVTKEIAKNAIGFYNSNFNYIPVGIKENPQTQLPKEYRLSQNYPNPFNPTTTIKYTIPPNVIPSGVEGGNNKIQSFQRTENIPSVQLKIYDILGREVTTLVNQKQKPGSYEIRFDASKLSSGVYYYRLQIEDFIHAKKMLLLK